MQACILRPDYFLPFHQLPSNKSIKQHRFVGFCLAYSQKKDWQSFLQRSCLRYLAEQYFGNVYKAEGNFVGIPNRSLWLKITPPHMTVGSQSSTGILSRSIHIITHPTPNSVQCALDYHILRPMEHENRFVLVIQRIGGQLLLGCPSAKHENHQGSQSKILY